MLKVLGISRFLVSWTIVNTVRGQVWSIISKRTKDIQSSINWFTLWVSELNIEYSIKSSNNLSVNTVDLFKSQVSAFKVSRYSSFLEELLLSGLKKGIKMSIILEVLGILSGVAAGNLATDLSGDEKKSEECKDDSHVD